MRRAQQTFWLAWIWLRVGVVCCLLAGCSSSEVQLNVSLTGLTAEVTSVQISIQFDASSTELRTQHLSQGIDRFIIAFPAERVTQGKIGLLLSGQDSRRCEIATGMAAAVSIDSSQRADVEVAMEILPESRCQLLVQKLGTGGGTVEHDPEQAKLFAKHIACGSTCRVSYPTDVDVTLIAKADPDSYFAGWSVRSGRASDGCSGLGVCRVTTENRLTDVRATFLPRQVCRPDGFCWEQPKPQGAALNAVWGARPDQVWAVGSGGTILLWNGSFWANYGSKTDQDLLDVWGANVDDVWAVGVGGTLLHWNGLLWEQREKTLAYDLSGVHGTGPNRVVVVGAGGLYMEWDGNRWTRRDVGTTLPLRRVWVSEHETWSLPSWGNDPQSKGFNFLHVTDSGVDRVVGVSPYLLRRIFGTAANRLWAVGDFNTVLEYDGTAWRPLPSPQSPQRPPPVFETVLAVWGTSAEDLWVAGNGLAFYRRTPTGFRSADTAPGFVNGMFGFSENEIFAVGNGGLLMRWNGAQWSSLSDNNYLSYNGLFSLGNNRALATSLEGIISYFDGSSWYPTYYFGRQIFSMWGTGADNLWVVTDLGGIYKYTGTSWQKQASNTLATLLSVSGRSPTDIWAVGVDVSGGKYLHFDGSTWAKVMIPATFVPIQVWDSGADDVWFVGLDAAILKYSRSTNSLVSFSMANSIDMNTVWGSSASDVWMAGFRADTAQGNAAVLLHWDGKTLTSLAPEGFSQNDSIETIWGLGPNDVWASGPAILAHYDGVKWTRSYGLGSTLRAFVNTAPPGSPPELLAAGLDGAILRRRAR